MSGGKLGASLAPTEWQPEDHGLATWNYDPVFATANTSYVAGDVAACAAFLRKPATVSNLWICLTSAAVTPTAGQNFLGLYNAAGVQLSAVSIDAQVLSSTLQAIPLASTLTLPAGRYYAAIVQQAATLAQFLRGNGASQNSINVNLAGPRARVILTLQTALPSPAIYTAGSNDKGFWWALS